jgi:hypothetical protein
LLKLYLDSNVMLKRYLSEPGTETTDKIFDKAETGELAVARAYFEQLTNLLEHVSAVALLPNKLT